MEVYYNNLYKKPEQIIEYPISFITFAKNRLEQVKQCVPNLVNICGPNDNVVFLDYTCQENSKFWVSKYRIEKNIAKNKLIILNMEFAHNWWHMNHARNCAAKGVTKLCSNTQILCFTDIDIMIPADFVQKIRELPKKTTLKIQDGVNTSGFYAIHREDFFELNGYEEALVGYGYDETSMYRAADCLGLGGIQYNGVLVTGLNVGEQTRVLETTNNWHENQAIYDILRKRHPYKNNVSRNWGQGAVPL